MRGAVGQPQLRGADQPRRQDELPRLAAARASPTRSPGRWTSTCYDEPLGEGQRRAAGLPQGHLAERAGDRARRRGRRALGDVPQELRRGLRRRRALELAEGARRRPLRVGATTRPTSASRRSSRAWRASPCRRADIEGARVLAVLGDSVTTDHISPAGSIKPDSPAGRYLQEHGVEPQDFNSYGARRGNHEVMMRGTFANIRLRNQLAPGTEGGVTRHLPDGERDVDLRRGDALRARTTCRSSCSPARSTARARRATGRRRGRCCWACAR